MAERPRPCVECGTTTDRWVQGWDGKYRCMGHAALGPKPEPDSKPTEREACPDILRDAKAKAWDEGHAAGQRRAWDEQDGWREDDPRLRNPYRPAPKDPGA